ncbi:invasion antigen B [Nitratifractor salsuginis DSM 16511]|uniref:Invasion antigen B n=2 Tax=Nitratifractor salsuginis TaxID=269261 RepID=E6X2I7_NITSE|nr:invasion antigen B [Nitratifractor salsuginis DSM 16511]
MRESFMRDLQALYDELQRRQEELGAYMEILHGKENPEATQTVERMLEQLGLPKNPETEMAALTRLVNLREDALEQVMKQEGFSAEEIIAAKEKAYFFVADFHLERFESLIVWIEEQGLLTPFYRSLISGVHAVGLAVTRWQNGWTSHIIHGINRELLELFNGDEEKIFETLREQKLLDRHEGEEADRCYSVLVPDSGGYRRVSYAEAFAEEVREVTQALTMLLETLEGLEDKIYGQKEPWLEYFRALKRAFAHTDPDELVAYWAEVDRAWMGVTTPIQVGHPLEYYEDHYRKAVALEWDLRVINPRLQTAVKVPEQIRAFGAHMAVELGLEAQRIFAKNVDQIEKTQLYIGRPMLYYGAEFNGLFSAQVVPNDEKVSSELGKKIFAYADYVRQSQKDKPVMQLSLESLGEELVRKRRVLLEQPERWMRLYEIATIGHEYGHILWIDSDTEVAMNRSGQFKNIEEFKATTGGLMAFFDYEEASLKEEVMEDLVSRAVGLMAWREVGEVLPYYCEGLIHLEILYRSRAIDFEGVRVHIDPAAYDRMKEGYRQAYRDLATHYVRKEDAADYLGCYAQKVDGHFLPVTPEVRKFVEAYYRRYLEIGQKIALIEG